MNFPIFQTHTLKIIEILPVQIGSRVCICLAFEPADENLGDNMHLAFVFSDQIEQKMSEDLWKIVSELTWTNAVPLRIHSECLLGDIMSSQDCDCNMQLDAAMGKIVDENAGVIIYLRQEGRGIGLRNKLKCLALQKGYTSGQFHGQYYSADAANLFYGFEKDYRDYTLATELLKSIGVTHVSLSTGNPEKLECLTKNGLKVQKIHFELSHSRGDYSKKALLELEEKSNRGYHYDYLNNKERIR